MTTRTARELMVSSTGIEADHDTYALDRTADQRLLLLQCRVGACACETASQLVGEIEGWQEVRPHVHSLVVQHRQCLQTGG